MKLSAAFSLHRWPLNYYFVNHYYIIGNYYIFGYNSSFWEERKLATTKTVLGGAYRSAKDNTVECNMASGFILKTSARLFSLQERIRSLADADKPMWRV